VKVTRADWATKAGGVDWENVRNKPDFAGGITDIGELLAAGFSVGKIPQWNGSSFVPADLPDDSAASTSSILPLDSPGVATRRQPPGFPFGPTQDVWFQEVFDVRQYGAMGQGSGFDDTAAINRAIQVMNGRNLPGILHFPAGSYRGGSFTQITVPCSIIGAGVGASSLNISGSGFSGGISGQWFEVAGLSMVSSGSASYGISMSDGSNAGMFSFHDVDIRHFDTPIIVNASQRRGFIYNCRLDPVLYGISLTAKESIISEILMVNDASTSTRGMLLAGSYHQVANAKFIAGSSKWNQGILASSGTAGTIANSLFSGVVNEIVELSDGSSGTDKWRTTNLTFFDCAAAQPVKYNRDKHYVNELQGVGSNTNTDFDSRRELTVAVVWDPPTLRPYETCYEEFYLLGCKIGDQVIPGAPYDLDFIQMSAKVRAADIVRITLTNTSPASINPASGTWKFRALN
jgi:hypothetical protein